MWQRIFSIIAAVLLFSTEMAIAQGPIHLIGIVHEHFEEAKNSAEDLVAARRSRQNYIEFINTHANPFDVVLVEGQPSDSTQFKPSRTIFKKTIDGNLVPVATFSKDLYIIGWEDLALQKLSLWTYQLLDTAVRSENPLAKLRASYLNYYVVLYQRNAALVRFLKDATQRMPPQKSIFLIIGDSHLSDPSFVEAVKQLGRDVEIAKHPNNSFDVHKLFNDLKAELNRLGQSPKMIEREFDTLYNKLKSQKFLAGDDLAAVENIILNLEDPDCDATLRPAI